MPKPALVLTQRDIEIILMVYFYDGVLISHLRRKFWPNVLSHTSYYRRIKKLIEAGYLKGSSSEPFTKADRIWLTVGPSARPLLSQWLGVSGHQLQTTTKTTSPFIVAHRAAVGDVRLSLELSAQIYPWIRFLEWQSEGELARVPMQVTEQVKHQEKTESVTRYILPDGAFNITTNTHSFRAFVEVDMGTIPHRLSQKLRDYLIFEKEIKPKIPVLFIVQDNFRMQKDRAKSILKWAQEAALGLGMSSEIFWIAKRADISEQTILTSPIWQVAGRPGELQKLPIPYIPQLVPSEEHTHTQPSL